MQDPSEVVSPAIAPSEGDLRGACEDLLRSWDATYLGVEEVSLGRADQEADPIRFLLVLAFAAHAHHLTGTACSMLDGGDYPSAVPLLRVAYESALTAAWAAESEDAALALHSQYLDGAGKLRADVRKTGWFDELLESVHEPETPPPSRRAPEARRRFDPPHGRGLALGPSDAALPLLKVLRLA